MNLPHETANASPKELHDSNSPNNPISSHRIYSAQKALNIAKKANKYARSQILKGATQLENNALSREKEKYLLIGVHGNVESDLLGIRNIILNESMKNGLEKNTFIKDYEINVQISSKFSLGNCGELAIQAFDYILINNIPINAEIFTIRGSKGNHAFLVLNRSMDSVPNNPHTWGNNVVVSDPWLDLFCLARKYRFKNYFRADNKNAVQTLNETDIISNFYAPDFPCPNITYFKENRSVDKLQSYFFKKCNILLTIIENCRAKMIFSKVGNRISKLDTVKGSINLTKESIKNQNFQDYREAHLVLTNELAKICQNILAILKLSEKELNLLNSKAQFQQKNYLYNIQESMINITFIHPNMTPPRNLLALKRAFKTGVKGISNLLFAANLQLQSERENLIAKFGNQDPGVKIICKKIKEINQVLKKADELFLLESLFQNNAQLINYKVNNLFIELCFHASSAASFKETEKLELFLEKGDINKFFNVSSDTKKNLSTFNSISLEISDICHKYFYKILNPEVKNTKEIGSAHSPGK
jgi:hypothetical protein